MKQSTFPTNKTMDIYQMMFRFLAIVCLVGMIETRLVKRSYSDQSVRSYLTERVCWWNEVCKEEFQQLFRCKCPVYSYCRSPGRYYNAYCSMTNTGYIWTQPSWDWVPVP